MKNKFLCVVLSFVLSLGTFVKPVTADATEANTYTAEQVLYIYNSYINIEDTMIDGLCNSEKFTYWSFIENTEESEVYNALINASSWILGQYPDEELCVEKIVNLISLQEQSLVAQVETQQEYDNIKTDVDYLFDAIGVATDFVDITGDGLGKEIAEIIDVSFGGAETVLFENPENIKYYNAIIQSYAQADYLLETIEDNSEIKAMRNAAKELRSVNEDLLIERVEYIKNAGETAIDFGNEVFSADMLVEVVKNSKQYSISKGLKSLGDKLGMVSQAYTLGKTTFEAMMLIGDIGFGTTNTFNRYQEMRIMADVANAISKSINDISIDKNISPETVSNIRKKCEYFHSLITVQLRGEYLIYKLVTEDAGLQSQLHVISELGKEKEDTTEGWYENVADYLGACDANLKQVFMVSESETVSAHPQLHVYSQTREEYYNYHCKVEVATLANVKVTDKVAEYQFELVEEFDVTEECCIKLESLGEYNPDRLCTYRITVSDLSNEPGTVETKYITVGKNGTDLSVYTNFKNSDLLFEILPDKFGFSSGVGGWGTEMSLDGDGGFSGTYYSPYSGSSQFNGRFSGIEAVDDFSYSMDLSYIETDGQVGVKPYGLDNGEKFMIYLPYTPVNILPEEFLSWSHIAEMREMPAGCYGIYNVNEGYGFVGTSEENTWWGDYSYYYGNRKSELLAWFTAPSHVVFWPEDGAVVINLCFNWQYNNQREFEAYDTYGSGKYKVKVDFDEVFSNAKVDIESYERVDLSPWGGTSDGKLSAVYYTE